MTDESEHPVLFLKKAALFTWEQHRPGGCRCVCRMYHDGELTCSAAAEPGLLLRVVAPTDSFQGAADITDALPLCAPCYAAITPLAEPPAQLDPLPPTGPTIADLVRESRTGPSRPDRPGL